MRPKRYLLALHIACSVLFAASAIADTHNQALLPQKAQPFSFIENKGQIIDQYNQPRPDVQFSLAAGDMDVFIGG